VSAEGSKELLLSSGHFSQGLGIEIGGLEGQHLHQVRGDVFD